MPFFFLSLQWNSKEESIFSFHFLASKCLLNLLWKDFPAKPLVSRSPMTFMCQILGSNLYPHLHYMRTEESGLDMKIGGMMTDQVQGCFASTYYPIFQQTAERIHGLRTQVPKWMLFSAPPWFLWEEYFKSEVEFSLWGQGQKIWVHCLSCR